jgi:teichuronic acid biosynthesis glycosyltransferase TuaC
MNIVTFTNLFPSDRMPRRGIFIQERMRYIASSEDVDVSVVALRPGLPFPGKGEQENPLDDIKAVSVVYQSVPSLPKISNWIDPILWANAAEPAVRAAIAGREHDSLLDAHFLYPDAAAAVILGRRLNIPVVSSARGSDVNVKCENPVMRRWVRWVVEHSAAVITVSQALRDVLESYGSPVAKVQVIRNGVDGQRFRQRDKVECRRRFGVDGTVIATVGHLLEDKGQRLTVEVLPKLPGLTLLLVGEGPDEQYLRERAITLGVADRVVFAGQVSHTDMPLVYSAADVTVLMSLREGMPNVVLESLACGTPVVATGVGGIPEVMTVAAAGMIVKDRSTAALHDALNQLLSRKRDPEATAAVAKALDWESVAIQQIALYQQVMLNYSD